MSEDEPKNSNDDDWGWEMASKGGAPDDGSWGEDEWMKDYL